MKGNEKVIDYLNRALRSELTAISQYWLHYRLQNDWGYGRLASKTRAESLEEMQHADRLMDRIIFLEGHPNMQKLDALNIGSNVRETLENDLTAEQGARALYQEAAQYCRSVGDIPSANLFEDLMRDEEDHIGFVETQLSLLDKIGDANYGHLNATPADES